MNARSTHLLLIKIVRLSGWFLLVVTLLYIMSGYALCGRFGFGRLIGPSSALRLHKTLNVPFVALFLLHSLPSIYLAVKRWTRTRKQT